jgi:hypothetical protein
MPLIIVIIPSWERFNTSDSWLKSEIGKPLRKSEGFDAIKPVRRTRRRNHNANKKRLAAFSVPKQSLPASVGSPGLSSIRFFHGLGVGSRRRQLGVGAFIAVVDDLVMIRRERVDRP